MSPRAQRLILAFIGACCAAMIAYPLLRVGQKLAYGEADPALVIYSEHAALFWRAWTAGYVGAMAGFGVWLVAERAPERVARALERGVVVAAALLAAQALLVP